MGDFEITQRILQIAHIDISYGSYRRRMEIRTRAGVMTRVRIVGGVRFYFIVVLHIFCNFTASYAVDIKVAETQISNVFCTKSYYLCKECLLAQCNFEILHDHFVRI